MIGYIYQIRNIINNKRYVGSTINLKKRQQTHFRTLRKGKHHNILLQRAFNKYGDESFVFEILQQIDIESDTELKSIEEGYLLSDNYEYNIALQASGGDMLTNNPNKDDIIERRTNTVNQAIANMTEDERKSIWSRPGEANGMYNKTHNEAARKIISEASRRTTEEGRHFRKKGKTNVELFGNERAEEISQKISIAAKKRIGDKNPFYGKQHSEETKQKIRRTKEDFMQQPAETRFERFKKQAKKIMINGVIYFGVSEAARQLGCSPGNISYHLKHNPNYKYID